MPLSEFELIDRFFAGRGPRRADVVLGIGDDCALLSAPPGYELAMTTDTLVEGVHFLPGTDPRDLGHKALAVNLSDLAAMGAEPAWFLLSLTLPSADADWLGAFADGLFALAARHGVALAGGNTTRGPLSITIQATGFVPLGRALQRGGARPGDRVFVTGTLGDAALALAARLGHADLSEDEAATLAARLDRPEPRVAAGLALRGLASACIDLSDGLAQDLGHVLAASGAGARVDAECLPLSPPVRAWIERTGRWDMVLAGGDDYELCFAVPTAQAELAVQDLRRAGVEATGIGEIVAGQGLSITRRGAPLAWSGVGGFAHF